MTDPYAARAEAAWEQLRPIDRARFALAMEDAVIDRANHVRTVERIACTRVPKPGDADVIQVERTWRKESAA